MQIVHKWNQEWEIAEKMVVGGSRVINNGNRGRTFTLYTIRKGAKHKTLRVGRALHI